MNASPTPAQRPGSAAAVALVAAATLALLPLLARGESGGEQVRRVGPGRGGAAAAPGREAIALKPIGRFRQPLFVTQAPGDRRDLFVVEKEGRIRVVRDGQVRRRPFLDVRERVLSQGTEQGLLSVAFPPDYPRSRRFYVYFTNNAGDVEVRQFRRSPASRLLAAPASHGVLLIQQPSPVHNGGLLVFGPDHHLYVGVGDGGPSYDPYGVGQRRRTLLGKVLRIDPRPGGGYSLPARNPFVGTRGWDQVYIYGVRNPWRFSFDRRTGDLIIGDVGQDTWEEVDYLPAGRARGANLGWSAFEGRARFRSPRAARNSVKPVLVYRHGPGCSVTGGYVVRDPALPQLRGRYVYGDFCTGRLRSFVPSLPRARRDRPLGLRVRGLTSFGEDLAGHVYAVSLEGPVYRLASRRRGDRGVKSARRATAARARRR